jgi:hypothetical protein
MVRVEKKLAGLDHVGTHEKYLLPWEKTAVAQDHVGQPILSAVRYCSCAESAAAP